MTALFSDGYLRGVLDACLNAKYAYFRDHRLLPSLFLISDEARTAVMDCLKEQVERFGSAEDNAKLEAGQAGPLTLYGVVVEVDRELSGVEARAEMRKPLADLRGAESAT